MTRIHDKRVAQIFEDVVDEIHDIAGVVATSYGRECAKDLALVWADDIFDRLIQGNLQPLDDRTVANRKSRSINMLGPDNPLFETGELFGKYLEFRHTTVPAKNYDILEVGIFNNTDLIGHSEKNKMTPHRLALMNEYGRADLNIPARPIFEESAMAMGYSADRIFESSWAKVKTAFDWGARTKSHDPTTVAGAASGFAGRKKRSITTQQTEIGTIDLGLGEVSIKWKREG